MAKQITPGKPGTNGAPAPGVRDALKSSVVGPGMKAKRVTFYDLCDAQGQWLKLLFYGESGTGKTRVIRDLLILGFRVVVVSTDFGGSGLSTVRNELKDMGLSHLGKNLIHADFPTFTDLEDFLAHPEQYSFEKYGFKNIYEFDPDWLCWEGLSGYQLHQLDSYISEMPALRSDKKDSGKGVSAQREAGLVLEQSDWGAVKRGTLTPLGDFLALHNFYTGKAWHKYVTCHESEPTDKNPKWRPLLQGAAGKILENAFDIIIETEKKVAPPLKAGEPARTIFTYECLGNDTLVAKSRGFNLAPVEEADFQKLWKKIAKYLDAAPTVPIKSVTESLEETSIQEEPASETGNTEPEGTVPAMSA